MPALSTTFKLVLDTNVVLDWLVFNDAALASLTESAQDGRVVLLTHQVAIDELQRVLNYPIMQLDAQRQAEILARYKVQTAAANVPVDFSLQNLHLPAGFPYCRDPDDQMFLAIAWHSQADALVSRDKAVLALRKRAAKFGVKIVDVATVAALLSR